jgi:hypothetical protein
VCVCGWGGGGIDVHIHIYVCMCTFYAWVGASVLRGVHLRRGYGTTVLYTQAERNTSYHLHQRLHWVFHHRTLARRLHLHVHILEGTQVRGKEWEGVQRDWRVAQRPGGRKRH